MSKIEWGEIMSDPTLSNLAKRINKRYLYMSEADTYYIINECFNAFRIRNDKRRKS